jgi:hypothetical protein
VDLRLCLIFLEQRARLSTPVRGGLRVRGARGIAASPEAVVVVAAAVALARGVVSVSVSGSGSGSGSLSAGDVALAWWSGCGSSVRDRSGYKLAPIATGTALVSLVAAALA